MKYLLNLSALSVLCMLMSLSELKALDSLALDGLVHDIAYSGSYVDFTIPKDIKQYDHIEFYLKGGDGGRRRVPNLCRTKGGDGAAVTVRFSIGTGNNELRPGGKIRFIVGQKGQSNGSNGIEGAGGGGGTAVLYLDPSLSGNPGCSRIISSQTFNNLPSDNLTSDHGSCWIILAVAGGGGGAYSSGVCGGSAGKGGNSGKNGTDGKGLDPGKGGIGGAPGLCGGGGLLSNSSCTSANDGGEGGYFTGGAGGNLGYQRGGFGYGGGGPSDASGGGGGGYSGGGNGTLTTGGGGGGSFANSDATYSRIIGGGTDGTPENGIITYVFKDLDSNIPDAKCKDITVQLDASGSVSFSADSSDNGSTNPISGALDFCYYTVIGCPGVVYLDCGDVGEITAFMVASNGMGASYCTSIITTEDNIPPNADCRDRNVNLNADGEAIITPYQINNASNDACGLKSLTLDQDTFTCDHIGPNIITLSVGDIHDNFSTCTALVNVRDEITPSITCQDITVGLTAGSVEVPISAAITSFIDNCEIASYTASPSTVDCSAIGTPQLVTLMVEDGGGNTSTCTALVSAIDTTPPTLICPSNQTVNTLSGTCSGTYSIPNPVMDNCADGPWGAAFSGNANGMPTDLSGIAPGSASGALTFELGATTVTLSGQDYFGNIASTCSFTITVRDKERPTVTCPSSFVIPGSITCGARYDFGYTGADNCQVAFWAIEYKPEGGVGGSSFGPIGNDLAGFLDMGLNTIKYQARDVGGNWAISCIFNVTVVDTFSPTINCPADITVGNALNQCKAVVTYTVSSSDNCSSASHVQSDVSGYTSGDEFPVGTTIQSYTATDAAGNTSTCSFHVTVNDTLPPHINCPSGNVVRNADPGQCDHTAVGQDLDVSATDNCQLQSITNDLNNTSSLDGAVFPKGKTLVTWTAWDVNGNSSTCSYHVKIRDKEAPLFDNCPDDTTLTVPFNSGGSYHTWPALTATDNCNSPSKLTITGFPLSGSFFSIGTTPVNWTATDKKNNVGNCDFEVTLVEQGAPTPNGWTQGGVGSSSSCATNWDATTGALVILSVGGNVSMSADNFCGVTIPHSGSIIDFRARVTPAGGSYYDQAGIMMRESLANNAKHATMLLTGTSVPVMSLRPSTGSFPLATAGTAVSKPYWLRLYRAGSTITGYISADGMNWSQVMSYPNVLGNSLYLVLFSTTSGVQGQATFDNITINGSAARLGEEVKGTELTLKAYPSPFSEDLFIEVENALPREAYQVRLSNMLGQRVYGYETGASAEGRIDQRISLAYLPAGTYLLEVSAGLQRKALKVVKQ